jgi:hypothetical protein
LKGKTLSNINYIKDDILIRCDSGVDDNELFTHLYTTGAWEQYESPELIGMSSLPIMAMRYGVRMAKPVSRVGLTSTAMCSAYARALLTRQNKRVNSAEATVIGDSRYQLNQYVYLENVNKLYYVESISHSYTAGKSYRTTLGLSLGRKPLFEYLLPLSLPAMLQRLKDNQEIDNFTYTKLTLLNNQNNLVNLLSFNGYIWEDIEPILYDDIKATLLDMLRSSIEGELDSAELGSYLSDFVQSTDITKRNNYVERLPRRSEYVEKVLDMYSSNIPLLIQTTEEERDSLLGFKKPLKFTVGNKE